MFGNRHDEEPERPRGRRHQPREMTSVGADPTPTARAATKANTDRYAQQRGQMQEGESFLDQMYKSERPGRSSNAGLPTGGKRRASGQHDNLNVFSWESGTSPAQAQKAPRGAAGGQAGPTTSPAPSSSAAAAAGAAGANQRRRDVEAQKFEMNGDGGFLRFSEDAKGKPQTGKAVQPAGRTAAPYGSPQHGMMDALMRDDTANAAVHDHPSKRHAKAPKASNEGGFAGFPGMGAQSKEKQPNHIRRKEVESNVFLPEAAPGLGQGGLGQGGLGQGGRAPPPANAAPRQTAPPPSAPREDEDVDLDDLMAALDPSQLTDDELQEYVAYLRYRQGGQDDAQQAGPSAGAHGRGGYDDRQANAYDDDQDDEAAQARRIMLYQQRQRGEY